jgi:flagellar biosynthetic protein FliR
MVVGLLVLARCAGFVFRAPGFSHPSVPAPLRGGFALVLAMLIAPTVAAAPPRVDGGAFVAAFLVEFLLGSAIGMAASLVYDGAYAGGRIVDDYVGVKAIAPSVVLVAPSGFGRVWSLAFTGAFFLTGAYRLTLLGFAQSFARYLCNRRCMRALGRRSQPFSARTFFWSHCKSPRRPWDWRSSFKLRSARFLE